MRAILKFLTPLGQNGSKVPDESSNRTQRSTREMRETSVTDNGSSVPSVCSCSILFPLIVFENVSFLRGSFALLDVAVDQPTHGLIQTPGPGTRSIAGTMNVEIMNRGTDFGYLSHLWTFFPTYGKNRAHLSVSFFHLRSHLRSHLRPPSPIYGVRFPFFGNEGWDRGLGSGATHYSARGGILPVVFEDANPMRPAIAGCFVGPAIGWPVSVFQ